MKKMLTEGPREEGEMPGGNFEVFGPRKEMVRRLVEDISFAAEELEPLRQEEKDALVGELSKDERARAEEVSFSQSGGEYSKNLDFIRALLGRDEYSATSPKRLAEFLFPSAAEFYGIFGTIAVAIAAYKFQREGKYPFRPNSDPNSYFPFAPKDGEKGLVEVTLETVWGRTINLLSKRREKEETKSGGATPESLAGEALGDEGRVIADFVQRAKELGQELKDVEPAEISFSLRFPGGEGEPRKSEDKLREEMGKLEAIWGTEKLAQLLVDERGGIRRELVALAEGLFPTETGRKWQLRDLFLAELIKDYPPEPDLPGPDYALGSIFNFIPLFTDPQGGTDGLLRTALRALVNDLEKVKTAESKPEVPEATPPPRRPGSLASRRRL